MGYLMVFFLSLWTLPVTNHYYGMEKSSCLISAFELHREKKKRFSNDIFGRTTLLIYVLDAETEKALYMIDEWLVLCLVLFICDELMNVVYYNLFTVHPC